MDETGIVCYPRGCEWQSSPELLCSRTVHVALISCLEVAKQAAELVVTSFALVEDRAFHLYVYTWSDE